MEVYSCGLNKEKDRAGWGWKKSGSFYVKSTYRHLCRDDTKVNCKVLWKAKLPLKIKIFMWPTVHNAILTEDNLRKRKWQGPDSCVFCLGKKIVEHLFFHCTMARYLWSLIVHTLGMICRQNSFE